MGRSRPKIEGVTRGPADVGETDLRCSWCAIAITASEPQARAPQLPDLKSMAKAGEAFQRIALRLAVKVAF